MQAAVGKNYEFQGREVFSVAPKIGKVDYLINDNLGRDVIAWINDRFGKNEDMFTKLFQYFSGYKKDQPIENGHILFEGAVSAALDDLGIEDFYTATPEQVMGFLRSNEFKDSKNTWNDFGVYIRTKDGAHQKLINHLMSQANIKEDMLPVILFHLRSSPDTESGYDSSVRLDYTENSG